MTKPYILSIVGKPRKKELYHFVGSGLPNVYLANGHTIQNDPEFGELVTIVSMPELFMVIAFRLTTKNEPLTGLEFRFLRKRMELSQPALAELLQVNEQTVANYEKGKTRDKGGPADVAIRLLFLAHVADDEEVADELRSEAEDLMKPSRRNSREPLRALPWTANECR